MSSSNGLNDPRTPCLVIAGTHSGVGKTTVATALMSAYRRRGLGVQAFKVGPDFIDPTFHEAATGRPSHNLDGWMLSAEANVAQYARAARDADLCIVEGVMGLFDGRSPDDEHGSTAQMAKWLGAPVLLVADGSAMARSAGAVVLGFESFDPDVRVEGVVFNRVSGERHFAYLRGGVQGRCRAKPLGFVSRNSDIKIPERHLGLHLANEVLTPDWLEALANWIEAGVDLDCLLSLANSAQPVSAVGSDEMHIDNRAVRIAVARDRAFQFYYQANLEQLQNLGAELAFFSPIEDSALPQGTDAVYLGGGYPELHAEALAQNDSMRRDISAFAQAGGAIYAECGGFMYLTEAIVDQNGCEHDMCALFPTRARMNGRLAALGYAELEVTEPCGWLPRIGQARGHQFRYSSIDPMPAEVRRAFTVNAHGDSQRDGFVVNNVIASYYHLHFGSCPAFAEAFVAAARSSRHAMHPATK